MARRYYEDKTPGWWDVRHWSKKQYLIASIVGVVVLVVAIVVGVVVGRNNAKNRKYPDYSFVNYTLVDTYADDNFFDMFDYFTGSDPSSGFVHYVDTDYAATYNLTYASSDSAIIRVDTTVGNTSTPDASTGRFSVRLTSKTQYNSGLFVFEVKHTPYGCATWPALWLTDPNNWPDHGEIDIMEAVNQATSGNMVTLHTTDDCTMSGVKREMLGSASQSNCDHDINGNAGCGVDGNSTTYGSAFNSAGGGTVAVEWRDAGIRVWQFLSGSAPADLASGAPDPSTWGTALADFPGTKCDIGTHFTNASIIANIDLCGDLGEAKYAASGCPLDCVGSHDCVGGYTPTNCTDFVANNPAAFADAFWEFGTFKVYQAA